MIVGAQPVVPASEIGVLRASEPRSVRLLRADPSLGDALDPRRFDAAREQIVGTSAVLDASIGPSDSLAKAPAPDTMLLVVAGLLLRPDPDGSWLLGALEEQGAHLSPFAA